MEDEKDLKLMANSIPIVHYFQASPAINNNCLLAPSFDCAQEGKRWVEYIRVMNSCPVRA